MNTNESDVREDLGYFFNKAVKNGELKPNFAAEKIGITTYNNRICLKCFMSRWFKSDENFILFPDGTGINLDESASDRNFRWTSVEARKVSFARSILMGLGLGAAGGALGAWAAPAAGALARKAGSALMWTGRAGNTAGKIATGAAAAGALGGTAYGAYRAGQSDAASQGHPEGGVPTNTNSGETGEVNEEIALATAAAIGAGVGAAIGGLVGLYKNRNNIIFYSDGRYVSKKGTIQGKWDGSAEQDQGNGNGGNGGGNGGGGNGGGNGGGAGGSRTDRRVLAMQIKLNQAGYTDDSGKKLVEDGILGPKTRQAAKKAGIDPETWNGEPPLTPANQNTNTSGNTGTSTADVSEGDLGVFNGGANEEQIRAFQFRNGLVDANGKTTGVYDIATAKKARDLALDRNSDFFAKGGTIKSWAEAYGYGRPEGPYAIGQEAGYNQAIADREKEELNNKVQEKLDELNEALDAYMKNNPAAAKRINYIKRQITKADFEDAIEKAGVLAQIGKRKRIIKLIEDYQALYEEQQGKKEEAINEIKGNFYNMLERINNATILQI